MQTLTILTGLVTEEAAMEITSVIIVMEQLTIQMVQLSAVVRTTKIKVTIMSIKMVDTNLEVVIFLVMYQNFKIHSTKLNNTMEILVKNMDKVRYSFYLSHIYFFLNVFPIFCFKLFSFYILIKRHYFF